MTYGYDANGSPAELPEIECTGQSTNPLEEDCRACSGEVCALCGAGCWGSIIAPRCSHDHFQRHIDGSGLTSEMIKEIGGY